MRRRLAATTALCACALALSSCGSTASDGSRTVRIALDYTANVDYLGIYAAIHNGYFAREHIHPVIVPYAETPAEPLIRSGAADLAISYPPQVIISRSGGLRYKAVAALVAGNTTGLAVLASSPVTRPAQLSGLLYGGFGLSSDRPVIETIMRDDGARHPSFREVVLNTGVTQALGSHRIGYTAVFEGIDDVTAALQGVKLRTFPYRDYLGAAGQFPNSVFVASDAEIEHRASVLRAALAALAQGYEFAARHPAAAERILIAENETALGNSARIVTATGNATAHDFLDAAGRWGPMDSSSFTALEAILAKAGLLRGHEPSSEELFTNSLLPGH
ncbi:MAG TPA: ABC transporter substrate-binding protein [Solirubrobacteraceae bacterium]|nr:ABC transporter substrate-binding protein [Solirubrobacteraceae bacterium]